MAPPQQQGGLFAAADASGSASAIAINARCMLRTTDGQRIVGVCGVPIAHFAVADRMAEAYAMVTFVDQGWADQVQVARAFACSTRTVRRAQRRFADGGLPALGRGAGFPKGRRRLSAARLRRVHAHKVTGLSNRAIAERLGITEKAVRQLLRRLGWKTPPVEQPALPLTGADPNLSGSASSATSATSPASREPASTPMAGEAHTAPHAAAHADPNLSASSADDVLPISFDTDPADRRLDRLFAYLGLLDDAAPVFRAGSHVPRAGVLLALPALLDSGVLECARAVYGSIGPAFYGLPTTIVAMLVMALLRLKRPEALKEHAPDELGRLLGLDRAPEVKTLRRKLARLAAMGRATTVGRALAAHRVAARGAALGFLYVDGHVRVYHGQRTIPKAHVARMRLAMPATTDSWVNAAAGEPLLVVTAEANAGMVRMLPPILAEVRTLVGPRRVTIVFDRGGFSPRLFQQILAAGFDVLTYRKGCVRRLPTRHFHERHATIDGSTVRYRLADQRVLLLGRTLRLRQVPRLADNGHQTPILTSRFDLDDVEVAVRMFARWRQENFFKSLREEYALDALAEYGVEEADPTREVPNPQWHALDAELRQARAEVAQLTAHYRHSPTSSAFAGPCAASRSRTRGSRARWSPRSSGAPRSRRAVPRCRDACRCTRSSRGTSSSSRPSASI